MTGQRVGPNAATAPRLRFKHRKAQTWDSGNPEAVDGYVTWCDGCGQRPWPCDTQRVLDASAALVALLDANRPTHTDECWRWMYRIAPRALGPGDRACICGSDAVSPADA